MKLTSSSMRPSAANPSVRGQRAEGVDGGSRLCHTPETEGVSVVEGVLRKGLEHGAHGETGKECVVHDGYRWRVSDEGELVVQG